MGELYHTYYFLCKGCLGLLAGGVLYKSELINTVEKHSRGWGVFRKVWGYLCRLGSSRDAGLLVENLGGGGCGGANPL